MAETAAAGLGDDVKAGVKAAGVALVALLIPVVHFVAGPLGPAVGAAVANMGRPVGMAGILRAALVEACTLTGVVAAVAAVGAWTSFGGANVPAWAAEWLTPGMVAGVLAGVFAWAGILGAAGGLVARALGPR